MPTGGFWLKSVCFNLLSLWCTVPGIRYCYYKGLVGRFIGEHSKTIYFLQFSVEMGGTFCPKFCFQRAFSEKFLEKIFALNSDGFYSILPQISRQNSSLWAQKFAANQFEFSMILKFSVQKLLNERGSEIKLEFAKRLQISW